MQIIDKDDMRLKVMDELGNTQLTKEVLAEAEEKINTRHAELINVMDDYQQKKTHAKYEEKWAGQKSLEGRRLKRVEVI